MKEALWYESNGEGNVKCLLCPHACLIPEGKRGICRVRSNTKGRLIAETYGVLSAIHLDPIEKKPLYHFFPGRKILSVGSVGCNLHCRFCQNCEISQVMPSEAGFLEHYSAQMIVEKAASIPGNSGIAYTYNEPVIWYEFIAEIAKSVNEKGMKNVLVTNGFVNPIPLSSYLEFIDAFSVDLKGFTEEFYREMTSAGLAPVKKSLEMIAASGRHLEIVNLVIPGKNDDIETFTSMVKWISDALGKDTVLHLSGYFPRYRYLEAPTSAQLLMKLSEIARKYLSFVYTGNISAGSNNTLCPSCGNLLIERSGYLTELRGVSEKGNCFNCGRTVFQNF